MYLILVLEPYNRRCRTSQILPVLPAPFFTNGPCQQYLDSKLEPHLKLDWYNDQAVKSEARRQANQPVRIDDQWATVILVDGPCTVVDFLLRTGASQFRESCTRRTIILLLLYCTVVA